METDYPVRDEIHVLKDGTRVGPLTIDEILDGLESGDFDPRDLCLRQGAAECERIEELLDWEETADEEFPALPEAGDANDPPREIDDSPPEASESLPEPRPAPSPVAPTLDRPDACVQRLAPSTILFRSHPSVVTFPFALACLVGGAVLGVWLLPRGIWFPIGGVAISGTALLYLLYQRAVCQYFITPRRVEIVTGFIAKSSNEARISDIRAINVERRGLSGMLGV